MAEKQAPENIEHIKEIARYFWEWMYIDPCGEDAIRPFVYSFSLVRFQKFNQFFHGFTPTLEEVYQAIEFLADRHMLIPLNDYPYGGVMVKIKLCVIYPGG